MKNSENQIFRSTYEAKSGNVNFYDLLDTSFIIIYLNENNIDAMAKM